MKQQSLASQVGLRSMAGRAAGSCFWMRWSRWFRGRLWSRWCEPHYAKAGNGRQPVGLVDHAADVLRAAVVQPVRPRRGGAAV